MSGSHFASENFCVEFKLQNQRLHRKCNHCPFCEAPDRDLSHYLNNCPKFQTPRKSFKKSLNEAGVASPKDLLDIFNLFFIPFNIKNNSSEQVGTLRDVSFSFAEFLTNIKDQFAN